MKSTFFVEMNPTGTYKHITYVNIPDLDAGRIPYPMSKKGRYAVGERKTVMFLLSIGIILIEEILFNHGKNNLMELKIALSFLSKLLFQTKIRILHLLKMHFNSLINRIMNKFSLFLYLLYFSIFI